MKKSLSEEIYPSSKVGKKIIYNKMVNHYKKIYNAKPWVDTNLKKKQRQWPQHTQAPHSCCSLNCEMHSHKPPTKAERVQTCLQLKKSMSSEECTFRPTILDTTVKSKLNGLNDIYHPPRRKFPAHVPSVTNIKKGYSNSGWSMKCVDRHATPETKMSNQDSAYAEGEDWSERQYIVGSHLCDSPGNSFRPQNSVCVRFLQDVTDEIINTGVYSNEALKKVFEKHLTSNRYNLNNELMKKEIEHLEVTLEIPINDELNSADFGLGNGEKSYSPYTHWTSSVDDNYVLEALESLNLHPGIKKDLIASLDLNSLVRIPDSCSNQGGTTTALNGSSETDEGTESKLSGEVIKRSEKDSESEKTSSQNAGAEELCQSLYDISEDYEEMEIIEKQNQIPIDSPSPQVLFDEDDDDKRESHSLELTSDSEISENLNEKSSSLHSIADPE